MKRFGLILAALALYVMVHIIGRPKGRPNLGQSWQDDAWDIYDEIASGPAD